MSMFSGERWPHRGDSQPPWPRLLELHIDKEAIEQAFKELTGNLSDLDQG